MIRRFLISIFGGGAVDVSYRRGLHAMRPQKGRRNPLVDRFVTQNPKTKIIKKTTLPGGEGVRQFLLKLQ